MHAVIYFIAKCKMSSLFMRRYHSICENPELFWIIFNYRKIQEKILEIVLQIQGNHESVF